MLNGSLCTQGHKGRVAGLSIPEWEREQDKKGERLSPPPQALTASLKFF